MQSPTISCPARYAPSTMEVCAPLSMRTLRSLYGETSCVKMTLQPAFLKGSSSSIQAGPSMTHRPNGSAVSSMLSR